uniref:Copper homeostasis protein cutC homolog n=1 Tax=Steinernema glaseri TaxID=37863 RepID=A0A1I7ZR45_9BILA
MVFLEICLDSFESAEAAVQGGAKRVEVCSSLPQGGLTPTTGLLKHIKSAFPEVIAFCMLRPRGGDFVYTKDELKTILMDCEELKKSGADGFVFGALTP